MPRTAREHSQFGYIHVICRGINKQVLFEEDRDYSFYLYLLEKYSRETGVAVNAYCLMDNHIHLLLCDLNRCVATMMKKIG
ncbi:MAG: transposase, partial [Eubacterium sp.]|nr:transposase [Eubacterium sp.]